MVRQRENDVRGFNCDLVWFSERKKKGFFLYILVVYFSYVDRRFFEVKENSCASTTARLGVHFLCPGSRTTDCCQKTSFIFLVGISMVWTS